VTLFLAFHPAKFMILNHPYYYLYYNQLVGGLIGAYSNYETDYYYHTIREGSEWLSGYLKNNKQETHPRIAGNFPLAWYFRDLPGIKTFYCQYDERSQKDWDYMIVANSYIPVNQLKSGLWPPKNAIHVIYTDKVPVCAVLKRESKYDLQGYEAFKRGDIPEAKANFAKAIKINTQDELTFYNFAAAMVKEGKIDSARYLLQTALKVNPGYEPVLMYLGNIAVSQGKNSEAIGYYETLIGYNRKYFEAYVSLSKLTVEKDVVRARELLKTCLRINSGYQPAIRALADTYRTSNPDVARKYDQLINSNK
jgi:tetratricopeptide (TPR) repeat protein